MQFRPKTRIDRYEIGEPLGAGGMGEIYSGFDTRLGRAVAIKVLRNDLPQVHDFQQRLIHEAHVLSTLNHPNICTLHDVVEVDGQPALIMELLEGVTLAQRLGDKSLTLQEAVNIGVQVASALGAAHSKGILHRDIKPGNIFLTPSGHAKVLDFGLAKLWASATHVKEVEITRSIDSTPVTEPGAVLGTFAYMAPEQALGKTLDPRSDIFSLGVVLYELCTGERPFSGNTLPALFDAVLHDNPLPARKRNPKISDGLERIIHRALERDPVRRQQTAAELERELSRLGSGNRRSGISALKWVVASSAILIASAYATYLLRLPRATNPVIRVSQATDVSGQELFPSLAPDGKTFAFVSRQRGNWDIYTQRVEGQNSTNLTGDSTWDDTQPAFSGDGGRIAFRSERDGGGIFLMGATGESVRKVTDFGYNPSWSPNGNQLVVASEGISDSVNRGRTSQLWTVDVQTGKKTLLYSGDAVQPNWSPHSDRIAFWSDLNGRREIRTISRTGGNPTTAVADAGISWNPVWSSDGRFLYYLSNKAGSMNVWRVSIDERSGAVRRPPEPVTTPAIDAAHLSLARSANRGMYVQRFSAANVHRIRFDGKSTLGAPIQVTRGTKMLLVSDVSANGEWIAFVTSGVQEDIYVIRSDGTGLKQLTNDLHKDRRPRWGPDGKRLIFDSNRTGRFELWQINSDGSALSQLTRRAGPGSIQAVWSNNGLEVAFSRPGDTPGVLNLATAEMRIPNCISCR